jgi:hypothetical protein
MQALSRRPLAQRRSVEPLPSLSDMNGAACNGMMWQLNPNAVTKLCAEEGTWRDAVAAGR